MFTDRRGRKVIVLAHCILNQNAKLDRCAHCPGAIAEVVGVLLEAGIGLVQMECAEMLHLGLDRQTDRSQPASVASEDTRIARRMQEPAARAIIDGIAERTVDQILDYRRQQFEVIGIVGINGSPTCGVETNWRDDGEPAGFGLLMQAIADRLNAAGTAVPLRGIRSIDPGDAATTVRALIAASTAPQL